MAFKKKISQLAGHVDREILLYLFILAVEPLAGGISDIIHGIKASTKPQCLSKFSIKFASNFELLGIFFD